MYSEEQYFYSIYVAPRDGHGDNNTNAHVAGLMRNSSGGVYCGPIEPFHMLGPMTGLSQEYQADWPVLAKFLKYMSANACIVFFLFILASVSILCFNFYLFFNFYIKVTSGSGWFII